MSSPRLRTAVLRGHRDKFRARDVATAPHSQSAGPSRQIPGAGCRNSSARPLRGAIATDSGREMSQRLRTAVLRGHRDKIPAWNVAKPPHSRSAEGLRRTPRRGEPPHPAYPRIPTTCREEPRRPAPQARADLRPQQRVSSWEDTSAAPGATLAPGGEWAERESPYRRLQFSSYGNTQKYYNWEETRDKSTPERPQARSLCQ